MTHVLRSRAVPAVKQKSASVAVDNSPVVDAGGSPSFGKAVSVSPTAKAVRLVYCDDKDGTFRMDAQAVAALQIVKGHVGVISVCGRARQGKSFILNQLLGRSNGFQVAPTHRPCTKGLWMWSTPLKSIAPDGTEYSIVLLDSEGIDAYDQTGTYSTQIFLLAVLLSSMFIYNQMGGIDEAALDRLSLVTEMTKHIRVRTSDHRPSTAELGQFSPVFLWLLRDFYLDLTEDGNRISPRDYLEGALQPLAGIGKDIASKNAIRDSIRALFPDRDCFTLVRPLNDECDLQRLDQIPMERLRPEFRSGLDALTKFIFNRTKPKQMGSIVMNGPMLANLTQSFLDAINAGAVPTIATSWQSVEESECIRAHDLSLERYIKAVNELKPNDEEDVRTLHEAAMENALDVFYSEAVGSAAARQKYEKSLVAAMRNHFKEVMQTSMMQAEMRCVKAIEDMDEKIWEACQTSATSDNVIELVNGLVAEYEKDTYGPVKWKKLAKFLQSSLEVPLSDLFKRQNSSSLAENNALQLRYHSLEEKLKVSDKQLNMARKEVQDWKKRYEAAIANSKALEEAAASRYAALQRTHSVLEANFSAMSEQLQAQGKDACDWRGKYEQHMVAKDDEKNQKDMEVEALKSKWAAAEGRLASMREQLESAKEEAAEWGRKYDMAVEDSHATSDKLSALCDRITIQAQSRQDSLREEFTSAMAKKDEDLRSAHLRIEEYNRILSTLEGMLEGQKLTLNVQDEELMVLRSELKNSKSLIDSAKASALSSAKEVDIFKQQRMYLEERVDTELRRLEEVEEKCQAAERETKIAIERAEKAQEASSRAEKDKLEAQRLSVEMLAAQERAERRTELLAREKADLRGQQECLQSVMQESQEKLKSLEKELENRETEMEEILSSAHKQRANTVQVLETLLSSERQACMDANARAESLSLQLQVTQGQLDSLQQELSTTRLNETLLDGKLKTHNGVLGGRAAVTSKRQRQEISVFDDHVEEGSNVNSKRQAVDTGEVSVSAKQQAVASGKGKGDDDVVHDVTEKLGNTNAHMDAVNEIAAKEVEDYMKFTISKLKQELTNAGFTDEILQLRSPTKKEILGLYERLILQKRHC